jgi:hypothetical protein
MANDIIDINVSETVDSVSITVNPNLTTVNINQVTGGLNQTLQSVTDLGATTTNSITANSFVKTGGTASQILAANGSVITAGTNITISGGTISAAGNGTTNLSTTQTASNFTINSNTGTDAIVPLGNGTLAGATLNDYTTAEKNKLAGITGTNTGDQNLQQVTNIGANTTNGINIDTEDTYEIGLYAISSGIGIKGESRETYGVYGISTSTAGVYGASDSGYGVEGNSDNGVAVYGNSQDNIGVQGNSSGGTAISAYSDYGTGLVATSESGVGVSAYSNSIGLEVNGNGTIAIEANLGNSNKGLVINSGASSTGNFIELDKNGVDKLIVNQAGELTAEKLIKSGGTSSQILAADGSVITAGNNITITGGQISSVGGAGGGGSSVNYYLNGGTNQGTFGGTTYYEFSKTAVIGTGADFNISSNGYIASFITDVADPSLLLIPAGNWNLEFFFSSSSAGGSPSFYAELYKYDGTTFTLIASGSAVPEGITNGTAIDAYFTALAVPETVLTVNDRLAIRVYVNASSKTITLHTQNGHICEVITTFSTGLTALNGLQAQVQNFATGTSGTDFAINSSGSTHTFNLPTASASNRGALSSANWTTFNNKQDTLQNTVNIKSINGNSILGSGDLTISGTGISSLNGLTGATQTFSVTTNTGTGIPAWTSSGTNHQLNIPTAGGSGVTGLITATSQFITGTKTFTSNPEIPVPAGNSGPCIVLGSTGGGGATGTLSIGDTVTYPNGVEMQHVKGVTSSVQTQLNGKASELDVAEQTYSLSPTFTGTAPTIISSSTYQWNKVGTLVTGRVNLIYTTPGSISQVVIPLPADMPTPLSPTGLTGALDILYYGVGMFNALTTSVSTLSRNCLLRRNVTNTGYEFVITHSSAISSRVISLTLQYFT